MLYHFFLYSFSKSSVTHSNKKAYNISYRFRTKPTNSNQNEYAWGGNKYHPDWSDSYYTLHFLTLPTKCSTDSEVLCVKGFHFISFICIPRIQTGLQIHRDMEIVTFAKQVLKVKTIIKSTIVTGIRSSTVLVVQQ